MKFIRITFIAIIIIVAASITFAVTKKQSFEQYINGVKKEAISLGVSKKTADKYLSNLKPPKPPKKPTLVRLQTHQAQTVLRFKKYKNQFINKADLPYARQQYIKNQTLIKRVQKDYQVPGQIIVALWGIESDYGRYTGDFPLINSLAILGYRHHRSKFYHRQLLDALIMLNRPKVIPEQLKSAWDGGMGQAQLEPAAYLAYAVDYDKNGFKNIWTSLPDVFASIANFLHQNGWNGKQGWGIPVKVPKNFPIKQAGDSFNYTVKHWQQLGVRQKDGESLPKVSGKTSILMPDGMKGDAYLAYPNFKVLLRWNNTVFEGLSTGILSDRIARIRGSMHE